MNTAVLVCALADAPNVVPGSSFAYCCRGCKRRVMVAPSGQKILREYDVVEVICGDCFSVVRGDMTIDFAGSPEEIRREVRAAIRNRRGVQ